MKNPWEIFGPKCIFSDTLMTSDDAGNFVIHFKNQKLFTLFSLVLFSLSYV